MVLAYDICSDIPLTSATSAGISTPLYPGQNVKMLIQEVKTDGANSNFTSLITSHMRMSKLPKF